MPEAATQLNKEEAANAKKTHFLDVGAFGFACIIFLSLLLVALLKYNPVRDFAAKIDDQIKGIEERGIPAGAARLNQEEAEQKQMRKVNHVQHARKLTVSINNQAAAAPPKPNLQEDQKSWIDSSLVVTGLSFTGMVALRATSLMLSLDNTRLHLWDVTAGGCGIIFFMCILLDIIMLYFRATETLMRNIKIIGGLIFFTLFLVVLVLIAEVLHFSQFALWYLYLYYRTQITLSLHPPTFLATHWTKLVFQPDQLLYS